MDDRWLSFLTTGGTPLPLAGPAGQCPCQRYAGPDRSHPGSHCAQCWCPEASQLSLLCSGRGALAQRPLPCVRGVVMAQVLPNRPFLLCFASWPEWHFAGCNRKLSVIPHLKTPACAKQLFPPGGLSFFIVLMGRSRLGCDPVSLWVPAPGTGSPKVMGL